LLTAAGGAHARVADPGPAVGASQQPDEPHPFPPDQLATYEALFKRLESGDREVTPEAEKFLQANPKNARAHYLAGVARLRGGDTVNGRLELEEALRLGIGPPKRRGALLGILAHAWFDDGRPRSRAYLAEAVRLLPDDTELLHVSARMDLQDRNFREARPKLERLAQQLPENGKVHAELAAVRWNEGDHPGALESVRRATSLGVTEPFFGHIEREVCREQWRRAAIIGLLAALGGITLWLGLLAIATSLLSWDRGGRPGGGEDQARVGRPDRSGAPRGEGLHGRGLVRGGAAGPVAPDSPGGDGRVRGFLGSLKISSEKSGASSCSYRQDGFRLSSTSSEFSSQPFPERRPGTTGHCFGK